MFSQRTTTALLEGLCNADDSTAWEELDGRCRPIMLAVARRMGLSDAEAEDAVQATLTTFLEAYRAGQFDRNRGRLSAFIITILRSRALDLRRRNLRRKEVQLDDRFADDCSEADIDRLWYDERQNQILREALQELRATGTSEHLLQAFELYGVRGVDIGEVTVRLGMSRDEVYNAKYRVARRLQPIVSRLDRLYEDI